MFVSSLYFRHVTSDVGYIFRYRPEIQLDDIETPLRIIAWRSRFNVPTCALFLYIIRTKTRSDPREVFTFYVIHITSWIEGSQSD